jgi:hypothetical protein
MSINPRTCRTGLRFLLKYYFALCQSRKRAIERIKEMAKFLIEVPHSEDTLACARVVQVFLSKGSHFLTQVDWGCMDGIHSAWMIVEAASKEEARLVVPPPFRSQAKIVGLNKFTPEQIEVVISQYKQ